MTSSPSIASRPRPAGKGQGAAPLPGPGPRRATGIEVRTAGFAQGRGGEAAFAALDADVAVVAAYGLILLRGRSQEMPRHGCLNIHGSPLLRWRGAAPVQGAILSGDNITGVTIMDMEAGLDTGPMRGQGMSPWSRTRRPAN